MTETTEGIVATLKRDKKGLKLENGDWYSNNFMPELNHVSVGDKVKITYKVNGNYKNHETVEVLEKAKASQVSKGKEFDPTTMVLSYVKDLSVASKKPMMDHVKDVLKTYNVIKTALDDETVMAQLIADGEFTVINEIPVTKV